MGAAAGCASAGDTKAVEVAFDTAVVWVRQGPDSVRAVVAVAASRAQHEVGLAGRAALEPESGMLFRFQPPRTAEEGFWMWRTSFPLDIAFIGSNGVIHGILGMDPCTSASQEDCPRYFAEAPYAAALEMSRGWFARHGIEAGATVRVEPRP
ncbi:MAG TPA: DUF192 domain-containing protein [Longimicrobiales bacterium]|nr:DUF192 domain-containing protein [Longimicrobiales bacterium]